MFYEIGPAHFQWSHVQPNNLCAKSFRHPRTVLGKHQHIASAEVDLVLQLQRHRHRCKRLRQISVVADDRTHACFPSGRQRYHFVTGTYHSARHAASKSPEICIGSNYHLHWESQILEGVARADRNGFQVFEQRWPLIPGRALASIDDVVPLQRADGHALYVGDSELPRQ